MGNLLHYAFHQLMWIVGVTAQLLGAMGIGATWVFMTVRCITFAVLDLVYFIPHVLWYILSPNIIRRVAYRSSKLTKLRNLEIFISEQALRPTAADLLAPTKDIPAKKKPGAGAHGKDGEGGAPLTKEETLNYIASALNPADGSFVNGLPINFADEHLVYNNSFDESLGILQKLYRARLQKEEEKKAQTKQQEQQQRQQETGAPSEDDAYSPLGARSTASSLTDNDDDMDVEDQQNIHNRATLDIYLPVPLDSLFRFMYQEEKSQARRVRQQGTLKRKKFPIVISVNGGAWIVGCYFWNFLVARVLAARGYVVFCPDYRNFPQTNAEGMVLDVSDAIAWVLDNAERYNGDLSDVTLMGQSAGAHLTMMSLLSQAQVSAFAAADADSDVPPPSNVAYNVPRYNPRQSIHHYVGLSGIYNVRGLVKHFDRRGLYRNVFFQIMGGKDQLPRFSLNSYFDDRRRGDTGESLPDNIFDYLPQRMSFVHGDADKSAPVSESANLVYVMRNAQRDYLVNAYKNEASRMKSAPPPVIFEFVLVPGATHTDAIIEEPLSCRNSHVVEFLTCYSLGTSGSDPSTSSASLQGRKLPIVSPSTGELPSDNDDMEIYPIEPAKRPDSILISPAPANKRRRLMRLASYICPF